MMYDKYRTNPRLETAGDTVIRLEGRLKEYIDNIIEQWIIPLPKSNPAMLDMYNDRNKPPFRNLLPYSGEFAGKYLTGAVQIYKLTHNEKLARHIDWFIDELLRSQAEDGYLGPWPDGYYLTGEAPPSSRYGFDDEIAPQLPWDAWDEYHLMLGLLSWHNATGNSKALDGTKKIADFLCDRFLTGEKRLGMLGWPEMNLSPMHSLCLLYRKTGESKYLALARRIEEDLACPPAGNYINEALSGKEYYQTPKPRWESLCTIQAIAELYLITAEEKYKRAFESIWWSIVKTDRHNTGGFSTNEQAVGDPYAIGAIETCCTAAWMALSIDMLRVCGNSIVADELELSTFNGGMGSISAEARWWTYDTPMDGYRKSFYQTHNFQARPGNPEYNCCSATGPKLIGMLSQWSIMRYDKGYAVNYYGPSSFDVPLPSGNRMQIEQVTDYPSGGKIVLTIHLDIPEHLGMKLRIPHWSKDTRVTLNGDPEQNVKSGSYHEIERIWRDGDTVTVLLDMSLHFWKGEKDFEGKCSIYRGPLLLAFDHSLNDMPSADYMPEFDARNIRESNTKVDHWYKPWVVYEYETLDKNRVRLCDFSSAGQRGRYYCSWLPVRNVSNRSFERSNPLRTTRPERKP